jgi:carbon-monoxide dehydrogenase medium subunit
MVALNPGWPGFQGLHEGSGGLTIGALTTLAAIAHDPLTVSYLPCLTGRNGLMNQVAGPGVRRLALALDARIQLLCQQGTRELNMADCYPVLASTDLIKSVTFPDCRGWRIAVEKLGHRERFSPTRATVACVCDGTQVRMAVCGEGGPARLTLSEAVLRDTSCDSPTALAKTLDDELERLGWQDPGLRLAIRRMLGYLREEVVSG